MPKSERFIILENGDADTILATAFETFNKLGWEVQFANENILLGTSGKNGQQIIATALPNELKVESEMVNGESFDITGKNKKNVNNFLDTYTKVEKEISQETLQNNTDKIYAIQIQSQEVIQKEQEEFAEIDKAMNLSNSNLYATYGIIAINVIVFILMVLNGAGLFDPNGLVHVKWGSNYGPLTTSGDWWRLLTCTFIHFGIIHIGMNMYCLYTVSIYLEPMLGKAKFITGYLCTGILASLVSLWWHSSNPTNSAGASGAVFGMYGIFLALLTTKLIPKKIRDEQLKSIGIFVVFNLAYGLKGGVDNAAHIGGLVSGFLIGYLFSFIIKAEKREQKLNWALPLIAFASLAVCLFYLNQNPTSKIERKKLLAELNQGSYKDNDIFIEKYNKVIDNQTKALAVYDDTTLNEIARKDRLTSLSLPLWEESEKIAKELTLLNIDSVQLVKSKYLYNYVLLRKEETALRIKMIDGEKGAEEKVVEVVKQIDELSGDLK